MKEIADTSGKTSIEAFPLVSKIPKRLRMPIYAGLTTLGVAGGVGAVCNSKETPKLSELQQHLGYSAALPFATGEQWWITSGPHADGLSDGVRYALDFAPSTPIACPGSEPYREKFVRAIGDGVVTVSGNENDPDDKNHSIVELDHGNTFTTGYMHLDEIQVEVGQKVEQGDPLGFASCESPAGGGTGGIHSHVYAELGDKPIEIDRVVLSGWTISATEGNYQGVMEKAGEQARTADRRRCGPSQETIDECGGIRNDIRWENIRLELAPTIALVPTIRPVETLEKPVIPTVAPKVETRQEEINRKWNLAIGLGQKFIGLMLDGSPQAITQAQAMQITPSETRIYPLYSYDIAPAVDLANCSRDMREGQFQQWTVLRDDPRSHIYTGSTPAEKMNKEQGLLGNDRYNTRSTFTFNSYNLSARRRIGFVTYTMLYVESSLTFEDTGDDLKLANNNLCFSIGSPIGGQYDWTFK